MKVNGRTKEAPVLTVCEHSISRRGTDERRWVVLNSNGGQSSLVYHHLEKALYAAAWEVLSWHLWLQEGNTFCK